MRSGPKNEPCIVHSDRVKPTVGVFLFPWHLEFVFFFSPNKAQSHKEIHSLSADSFPVRLKVTSQFLHLHSQGRVCICAKLQLRAGGSDPSRGARGCPCSPARALPHRDLPQGSLAWPRVPLIQRAEGVLSGAVVRGNLTEGSIVGLWSGKTLLRL